jgi:hypothetical protein
VSNQSPNGGQYRCSKCYQTFDSVEEKRKHEQEHHQQQEPKKKQPGR